MRSNVLFSILVVLCYMDVTHQSVKVENGTTLGHNEAPDLEPEFDLDAFLLKVRNQTRSIEKGVQKVMKSAVKSILPGLMSFSKESPLSTKCMGAFMKYISGLTNVKVWAMKMLDAMSKPPSGILEGTWSDFGAFDMCLEVELPSRRGGGLEFRGQYCAVEIQPYLPPAPRNFSMAKNPRAGPLDSLGEEIRIGGRAFHYLKFRLGVCVPSLCTLEEMQAIGNLVSRQIDMEVKVPQCYVKEETRLEAIHVAVICVLTILLVTCIAGSITEYRTNDSSREKKLSKYEQILLCFSLPSNSGRLFSESKGSKELKALHGLRALSMAWVMLGHTYVWMNFQLWRSPAIIPGLFNNIDFGAILNAWLSVEPFFLLSGLLTSYAVMKILPKTKGRINVPVFILRRYVRLTPLLLLAMGLIFFLPLISSGPFWYERVDPEIRSCTKHWWRSILYISNWMGMKNICVHPTWYLSADFQLYIISIVFLFALYSCPKLGLAMIAVFVVASTAMVAALTAVWDLPPFILISSGKFKEIEQTVDIVHMNTLTHAGPYCIGVVVGYVLAKYKDIKLGKATVSIGWCASAVLCLGAVYGGHAWNVGDFPGPAPTALFACLHRSAFALGVAWVAFACVTGHGGPVNRILSSSALAPFSRLTFVLYVLHPLVIWTRRGTQRERVYASHYNVVYEYVGNVAITVLASVPVYLLLEAPLSNLERMLFSALGGGADKTGEKSSRQPTGDGTDERPVEILAVRSLERGHDNPSFTAARLKSNGA